jgi:tryptophanase
MKIWVYNKIKEYLISMVCVDYGIKSCADIATWQENCYFIEMIKNSVNQFDG